MPPKPTLYSEEMSIENHMSNPIEAQTTSCNSMGTITPPVGAMIPLTFIYYNLYTLSLFIHILLNI